MIMNGKRKLSENTDVLTGTQQVIRTALETMNEPPAMFDLLKEPLRMLTVRIPVKMDDGSVQVLPDTVPSTTTRSGRPKAACDFTPTSRPRK
ncbi:hypothetical protein HMSSN139_43440 [Paenibacillus sp. HMSSN-139]|nr:hypothetical protein HMSSN139_43440 [Paenibacillus sp. HMSSN-139]